MFVASYARLPSITARDTTSVPLHYGSGPLLQCAVAPPRRSGPLLQCAVPPRRRSGPLLQCAVPPRCRALQCNPLGPIAMRGAASVPLGPSITMRGTASVPLGPSITMRGAASAPLLHRSGPLLQCASNTPFGFYKVFLDRSEKLPRKHKDQRKATKRNLNIVVPALLQTGRSTLAPRHSKCTSRSTILFGWSVSCRLLDVWTSWRTSFVCRANMRVCGHWAGDWCSPCIGAGFDTLTFQSMIVHFFVALAKKIGCGPSLPPQAGRTGDHHWGGPLWRGWFLLGFLVPKLVSRKITFFDPLKEQKDWKTCEG